MSVSTTISVDRGGNEGGGSEGEGGKVVDEEGGDGEGGGGEGRRGGSGDGEGGGNKGGGGGAWDWAFTTRAFKVRASSRDRISVTKK